MIDKAILFGLLENFEFAPPPEGLDNIQRVPGTYLVHISFKFILIHPPY